MLVCVFFVRLFPRLHPPPTSPPHLFASVQDGFVKSFSTVHAEFVRERNLRPVRVAVLGAPATGKSQVANALAKVRPVAAAAAVAAIAEPRRVGRWNAPPLHNRCTTAAQSLYYRRTTAVLLLQHRCDSAVLLLRSCCSAAAILLCCCCCCVEQAYHVPLVTAGEVVAVVSGKAPSPYGPVALPADLTDRLAEIAAAPGARFPTKVLARAVHAVLSAPRLRNRG
jgi:hypothetical protein